MASRNELAESFSALLGEEAVFSEPETLDEYRRCGGIAPEGNPLLVVRPRTAREVQQIVKLAGRTGVNLVAASSGPPHFRGGTVPSGDGVIVDLSRMNRIIMVDRRNKVAVIEPGVTFADLKEAAGAKGMKVLMPLLPRDLKSVLASYLEREPITIPKYHWDMTDPLLCTELVFGTGDFFRTGAAAGPGTLEEMSRAGIGLKNPMGPSATDLVRVVQGAQGTMGVVTWASVKLEVLPRVRRCYFAPHARLEKVIDFTYSVMKRKMADEYLILNGNALACMFMDDHDGMKRMAGRQALFTAVFCLAGYEFLPEKRVAYLGKDIAKIAQHAGVNIAREINGCSAHKMASLLDEPCKGRFWKFRLRGGCREIFFLTTLDRAPYFVEFMNGVLDEEGLSREDVGLYIQPIQQGRACHTEFHLHYDPADEREKKRVEEVALKTSKALAERGAFFSRPYGPWADIAYSRCPETAEVLRKLKKVFDPDGILNRGKLCFEGV